MDATQIRQVLGGQPSIEYLEAPNLFWIIKLLDFGFLIPLLIATFIGLIRRQPRAVISAYGLILFSSCLILAIAGMAIAMQITGDPAAQPVMLGLVLAAGLGLAVVTFHLLRSIEDGPGSGQSAGERPMRGRAGREQR